MERIDKMLVWKNVLNGEGVVAVHSPDTESALWVLLREYEKTLDTNLEVFFNQIFDYEGEYSTVNYVEMIKTLKTLPEEMHFVIVRG